MKFFKLMTPVKGYIDGKRRVIKTGSIHQLMDYNFFSGVYTMMSISSGITFPVIDLDMFKEIPEDKVKCRVVGAHH